VKIAQTTVLSVLIAGWLALAGLSADTASAKPDGVDICHLNGANEGFSVLLPGPVLLELQFSFGRIISVPESAALDHFEHGDVDQEFFTLTQSDRDDFEAEQGISLPNANCFVTVVTPA
jgi:hypothetical protein